MSAFCDQNEYCFTHEIKFKRVNEAMKKLKDKVSEMERLYKMDNKRLIYFNYERKQKMDELMLEIADLNMDLSNENLGFNEIVSVGGCPNGHDFDVYHWQRLQRATRLLDTALPKVLKLTQYVDEKIACIRHQNPINKKPKPMRPAKKKIHYILRQVVVVKSNKKGFTSKTKPNRQTKKK